MVLDRITRNPEVMGGKPCVRGMRVTVGMIVGLLAAGRSQDEILAAYPYLEGDDIQQAVSHAARGVDEIEAPMPSSGTSNQPAAIQTIDRVGRLE